MDASNEWSQVDPKNAKILALTMRLESLENANKSSANSTGTALATAGTTIQDTSNLIGGVATWRTTRNKGDS